MTSAGLTFSMPSNMVDQVSAEIAGPTSLEDCQENFGGRISFCHATSSETNPYNFHYNQPCTAAFHAGHFEEPGSQNSGHEDDFFTDDEDVNCGRDTVVPTCEELGTCYEPTPTPKVEVKVETAIYSESSCDSNDVKVIYYLKEDGEEIEGVGVEFEYNGTVKTAHTGSDGKAVVKFEYTGEAYAYARPDAQKHEETHISKAT